MKKALKKGFTRDLIRPVIYQTCTRLAVGLIIALVWKRFVDHAASGNMNYPFAVAGILFGILAWMAYLRLDGMKLPVFDRKLFRPRKKPVIHTFGDMIDHVDDEPVTFEELEPEGKDACLLLSNLTACVLLVILSFLPI